MSRVPRKARSTKGSLPLSVSLWTFGLRQKRYRYIKRKGTSFLSFFFFLNKSSPSFPSLLLPPFLCQIKRVVALDFHHPRPFTPSFLQESPLRLSGKGPEGSSSPGRIFSEFLTS